MQNTLNFEKIGRKIKEVRLEKQLTQEYIANYVGINVSHVSNIETNKVKVSLSTLVSICNALQVTIDYILKSEYAIATSPIIEKELKNTLSHMNQEKQEQLLRIAKVL